MEVLAKLSGFCSGGLDLLRDDGAGWRLTAFPDLFSFASRPLVNDFDGDGFDDFAAVGGTGDRRLRIRFGSDGPQLFTITSPSNYVFGNSPSVAAPDFDGDGDRDLVVKSSSELAVYRYEGARVFTPVGAPGPPPASTQSLTAVDIDRDGWDDLVVSSNAPGSVDDLNWLRSLGNGQFAPPVRLLLGGAPLADAMRSVDVDGDGDLDVVLMVARAGSASRTSAWVELGPGPTAALRRNHLPSPISTIVIGGLIDVNLDGSLDAVEFEPGGSELLVAYGGGGGAFSAPQIAATDPGIQGATAVDVDGDGDLDLVSGKIEWFENISEASTPTCRGAANSAGPGAPLIAAGSEFAAVNRTTINVTNLPPGSFGMFITSLAPTTPFQPPGSLGELCLGGSIGRFNRAGEIRSASPSGTLRLVIDTDDVPDAMLGSVGIAAPESRYFQLWYRDTVGGASVSNFSGAARIDFR